MLNKAVELVQARIKKPSLPRNKVVMDSYVVQRQTATWQ